MTRLSVEEIYNKYKNIDLKGINIDIHNNKIIPIITKMGLYKINSKRIKILLYLIKLIGDNKPKTAKDIVYYLETSIKNRIEILKFLNEEIQKEPLLGDIIIDKELPYKIQELNTKIEEDPYIIKAENGQITNILFDFIEKVSKKTKFLFGSKYPRTIGLNVKATKTFLKESSISLEELEWFFDKVYIQFIYDGFQHKSIRGFIIEAEEYFYNKEKTQLTIKALMIYLKIKNINLTPLTIGGALNKNKQIIHSILDNIGNNLDSYEKIIKDFNKKYKSNGLNWTLNTVFNNLFTDYGKYIKTEDNKENTNLLEISMEEEFANYIKLQKIIDNDLIKELYSIYKKEGLSKITNLLEKNK